MMMFLVRFGNLKFVKNKIKSQLTSFKATLMVERKRELMLKEKTKRKRKEKKVEVVVVSQNKTSTKKKKYHKTKQMNRK
jgi:hypothetical protein